MQDDVSDQQLLQRKPLRQLINDLAKPGGLEKDDLTDKERKGIHMVLQEGLRSAIETIPEGSNLAEFNISPTQMAGLLKFAENSVNGGPLKKKAAKKVAKDFLDGWVSYVRCAPVLKRVELYAAELEAEIRTQQE